MWVNGPDRTMLLRSTNVVPGNLDHMVLYDQQADTSHDRYSATAYPQRQNPFL